MKRGGQGGEVPPAQGQPRCGAERGRQDAHHLCPTSLQIHPSWQVALMSVPPLCLPGHCDGRCGNETQLDGVTVPCPGPVATRDPGCGVGGSPHAPRPPLCHRLPTQWGSCPRPRLVAEGMPKRDVSKAPSDPEPPAASSICQQAGAWPPASHFQRHKKL